MPNKPYVLTVADILAHVLPGETPASTPVKLHVLADTSNLDELHFTGVWADPKGEVHLLLDTD